MDLHATGLCPVHDSLGVVQYVFFGLVDLYQWGRHDALPGLRIDRDSNIKRAHGIHDVVYCLNFLEALGTADSKV